MKIDRKKKTIYLTLEEFERLPRAYLCDSFEKGEIFRNKNNKGKWEILECLEVNKLNEPAWSEPLNIIITQ